MKCQKNSWPIRLKWLQKWLKCASKELNFDYMLNRLKQLFLRVDEPRSDSYKDRDVFFFRKIV